jgi:prepilin-type N-terminal cleavage/methylation domain-containing protein
MKRCAQSHHGAYKSPGKQSGFVQLPHVSRRGFTLLEMCIVLFLMALLAGAMMPAMQSAFIEQAMRKDSHQLSLMIKTAMLQSSEQHRPYVMDLTPTTMVLHPVGEPPKEVDSSPSDRDENASDKNSAEEDVTVSSQINPPNKLLLRDPDKPKAWLPMASASWLFLPGELCPVPRVRLTRGQAWVEMSFNALTGNVEDETSYFP